MVLVIQLKRFVGGIIESAIWLPPAVYDKMWEEKDALRNEHLHKMKPGCAAGYENDFPVQSIIWEQKVFRP